MYYMCIPDLIYTINNIILISTAFFRFTIISLIASTVDERGWDETLHLFQYQVPILTRVV